MIQQCPAGNQQEVVWGMGSGAGAGVGTGKAAGNRQPRTLPRCVCFFFLSFSVAGLLDRPEESMTGTQRASLRSASVVHCPLSSNSGSHVSAKQDILQANGFGPEVCSIVDASEKTIASQDAPRLV